jgi:hypothetical protein
VAINPTEISIGLFFKNLPQTPFVVFGTKQIP